MKRPFEYIENSKTLEEAKCLAIKVLNRSSPKGDRKQFLIDAINGFDNKEEIIKLLWNLLLSSEGLSSLDSTWNSSFTKEGKYIKKNKRNNKKF